MINILQCGKDQKAKVLITNESLSKFGLIAPSEPRERMLCSQQQFTPFFCNSVTFYKEIGYSVGLPYIPMGIYTVFEILNNFVLGMGIYTVFYKGVSVFYVYWSVFGGWAYILFWGHFKKYAKSTTIYTGIYGSPTPYSIYHVYDGSERDCNLRLQSEVF